MIYIRCVRNIVFLMLTAVLASCDGKNTNVAAPDTTKPTLTINSQESAKDVVLAAPNPKAAVIPTIDGGFGFFLGDIYRLSLETINKTGSFGMLSILGVQPPSPNSTFLFYALTLTPKTKRIAEIQAHRLMNSPDECKESATAIQKTLEDKYGLSNPVPNEENNFHRAIIQGNRGIVIMCNFVEGEYDFSVGYYDNELRTQGKQEAVDISSEKQDSTGL